MLFIALGIRYPLLHTKQSLSSYFTPPGIIVGFELERRGFSWFRQISPPNASLQWCYAHTVEALAQFVLSFDQKI